MLQYIHQNITMSPIRIELQLKGIYNVMHYAFFLLFIYSEAWLICNYQLAFCANQYNLL